jgi:hypothetical protein
MNEPATTHSLERTSPMGGAFVGRCVLCGALGLPSGAALWPCPNPSRKSEDQALIDAIERPATTSQEEER